MDLRGASMEQIGGSGIMVSPLTYIFDEQPERWSALLEKLGIENYDSFVPTLSKWVMPSTPLGQSHVEACTDESVQELKQSALPYATGYQWLKPGWQDWWVDPAKTCNLKVASQAFTNNELEQWYFKNRFRDVDWGLLGELWWMNILSTQWWPS